MNEGKFKEFIHALELTSMNTYNAEALRGLVDKANKEFPVDDMPNSTPDHEMLLRLVKLNRERLGWRLEWLGEQEIAEGGLKKETSIGHSRLRTDKGEAGYLFKLQYSYQCLVCKRTFGELDDALNCKHGEQK